MNIKNLKCKAQVKWNGNHYTSEEWIEGYIFIKDFSDEIYMIDITEDEFGNSSFAEVEVIPSSICQFTGHYDKYHREIYEHDRVLMEVKTLKGTEKFETEVYYDEGKGGFYPFTDTYECDICDRFMKILSMKIIEGNNDIYMEERK